MLAEQGRLRTAGLGPSQPNRRPVSSRFRKPVVALEQRGPPYAAASVTDGPHARSPASSVLVRSAMAEVLALGLSVLTGAERRSISRYTSRSTPPVQTTRCPPGQPRSSCRPCGMDKSWDAPAHSKRDLDQVEARRCPLMNAAAITVRPYRNGSVVHRRARRPVRAISAPCSRRRPVRRRRPRSWHRGCTATAPPQRSPPAHRVG